MVLQLHGYRWLVLMYLCACACASACACMFYFYLHREIFQPPYANTQGVTSSPPGSPGCCAWGLWPHPPPGDTPPGGAAHKNPKSNYSSDNNRTARKSSKIQKIADLLQAKAGTNSVQLLCRIPTPKSMRGSIEHGYRPAAMGRNAPNESAYKARRVFVRSLPRNKTTKAFDVNLYDLSIEWEESNEYKCV